MVTYRYELGIASGRAKREATSPVFGHFPYCFARRPPKFQIWRRRPLDVPDVSPHSSRPDERRLFPSVIGALLGNDFKAIICLCQTTARICVRGKICILVWPAALGVSPLPWFRLRHILAYYARRVFNSFVLKPFHSQEWSMSNFPCSLAWNITSHSMENLTFHIAY